MCGLIRIWFVIRERERERERETTTGVVFTVYSGIVISFASCYLFCSFAGNRECVIAVSGDVVCGKFFLLLNR